ncbi:MAG: Arc family DNA-binding protein [Deltaproteobacteria bacterium]|nr:Arc family DNA-binding protein [Deltaproteobacteria bacterium]
MATLNIKGLPERLYKKLRARAKRNHRSIAQEVTQILSGALEEPQPRSILELQGLGKELWSHRPATEHVDEERRTWD